MGMMAKMRSLAPWFIITVGGLFVLFMVLSDSQVVQIMGQRSNNIGYVNGEPITYQQFSNYLEIVRQQQKAQTGEDVDESQMEALRDQVWDALVNQMLIDEKIDDFGIVVTDEEIRDIILGPNPPAFLKQNFIDSTGVFNRQLYEQAIFSPQNRDAVIQAEETIRAQLIQEKLRSFLTGSIIVSDSEVKRKYIEQNVKISAEFALFEYNRIPDSAVTVTDEDLKNYYEEHKSDYKIDPQRKLKYVLFERKASEEDSASIKNNLVEIIKDLEQDTSTFRTYVNIYSDQPYSKDTLTVNQIHPEAVKILSEAKEGEIIGPVLTTEGYAVYKLVDKFRGSDEFAEASHILVSGNDDAAKQKADSIYQAIQNGADFAQTAIEVSDDPGSGKRGGYLGWFTKGQMVPEFEKAVFNGRVGVVQRPFTSQFGYHIVKVLGKTNYKYVVEKIVNKIEPSGTTLDRLYENAGDFAYLAKENDFESEAELMGYEIVETPPFGENASFIGGIGASKALVKFAFENSLGDVSDVYRVPSGYVVAMISEATKAGFRPFDEVQKQIRIAVIREKKFEKTEDIAQEVYEKIKNENSLTAVSQYNSSAVVDKVLNFTPQGNIPKVGRDNAFLAYCLDAEIGKISTPVRGNRGTYLIMVKERTEIDEEDFAKQANTLRTNLLQQKKTQYFTQWIENIRDEADIVDNRHLFYR
jgi:parvulin-like peptidyl-prolyl isomerase